MAKFLPNLYELLKGIICAISGVWKNIHSMWSRINMLCKSVDNVFSLIRGGAPSKSHYGYFTDEFLNATSGAWIPSPGPTDPSANWKEFFRPDFQADILEGAGCDSSKKLGRYRLTNSWLDPHYPYVHAWKIDQLPQNNMVIGTIPWSDDMENDIHLSRWKTQLRSSQLWRWGKLDSGLIYVFTKGYCVIDGVEFNPDLKEYGENTMVIFWSNPVGEVRPGGMNGSSSVNAQTMSYDA